VVLVGGLAVWLTGCGDEAAPPGPSEANPLDSEESALLTGLNAARSSALLEPLVACTSLNASASAHSDDMRDESFVAGEGSDGSTARERACEAGYQPACAEAMFLEAVGSGGRTGEIMLRNWRDDATTNQVILDANLVVAGVGRSLTEDGGAVWTLDLGLENDPSCE